VPRNRVEAVRQAMATQDPPKEKKDKVRSNNNIFVVISSKIHQNYFANIKQM